MGFAAGFEPPDTREYTAPGSGNFPLVSWLFVGIVAALL